MSEIKVGRYLIKTTNEDRILFPKSKISKGDLIEYYQKIAPYMISHIKNRAITMVRYPRGIQHEGFFQKDASDYFPTWIKQFCVDKKTEAGQTCYILMNNAATAVYIANQGCITPHMWLSLIDKPDYPNVIIFDIDPSDIKQFPLVQKGALLLKNIIEDQGLTPFIKTTGSKGLHVTIPIKRTVNFKQARAYAQKITDTLIKEEPKYFTNQFRKEKRNGKILIDTFRNAFAQTVVVPYGVRPKEGAPIAMPITWDEVEDKKLTSQRYTINNVFNYLKKHDDPWQHMMDYAKSIKGLL